ncbi:MAG: DNA primase [Deltaproteobacteria bacterium]|nr:MAG: DNA primase [Deltaproteobacteria bacterium]
MCGSPRCRPPRTPRRATRAGPPSERTPGGVGQGSRHMVPREVIDTIRERVDIVDVVGQVVTLKRKGSSYVGLCPFHQEKTPSFNVVPHKGIFHCFGCGAGGDVFQFLMQTQGLSFHEALKELGNRVGVAVEDRELTPAERQQHKVRHDLYEVCELAGGWFEAVLRTRPEGEPARAYLAGRGIEEATWERYRLGYAPPSWNGLVDWLAKRGVPPEMAIAAGLARPRRGGGAYDLFRGRVIVPIQDARGRIVAFGGRHLEAMPDRRGQDGEAPPKYVNSPETAIYSKSKVLYALSHARPAIQRAGQVIVVEGYFDVLSLHQAGFRQTVATCGTALTREHLQSLRPLTTSVIALFDGDAAGVRAALRSLDLFVGAGMEARRLDLGDSKDPDEFIQTHGAEAFAARLRDSETLFDLAIRHHKERLGSTPEGRRQALMELVPIVRKLDAAPREVLIERLATSLDIRDDVVREVVGLGRRAGPPAAARVPPPARFRGSRELNHLLWLLVNHRDEVAPIVAQVDPGVVTDRLDVATVVARLLAGDPLTSIIEDVEDPDLVAILRRCAVTDPRVRDGRGEELYTVEQAAPAARQMLARLELRRVEAQISRIQQELEGCSPGSDGSRYREALVKKSHLARKRQELLKVANRRLVTRA